VRHPDAPAALLRIYRVQQRIGIKTLEQNHGPAEANAT